jgi:hypothetical protein
LTATTDQNGFAVVTLQVPTSAITQIATIRATDVTSGNSISSNFTIVAFNDGSAVLSVSPESISVPGLPHDPPQCAIGVPVTYLVFGGTPPYTVVASLPFVTFAGVPVLNSGGSFTVRATACVDNDTLTITDASGRFITATFSSVLGPAATTGGGGTTPGDCASFSPANPACPTGPTSMALSTCAEVANATITPGTTPLTGATATGGLTALLNNGTGTLSVSRASGTATTPASVQINAGSFFITVPVTLSGAAAGAC